MNYDIGEIDGLVNDWIRFQYKMEDATSQKKEDEIEEYDMDFMDKIIHKTPKLALSIIVKILEKDTERRFLPVLAAGELEDLLSIHGEEIIDLIEDLAKKNPKFKKLLGGVWQGDMSDKFYKRIVEIAGGEEARW